MKNYLKLFLILLTTISLYAKEIRVASSIDESGNMNLSTIELMGYYKSYGLELMLSVITLPEGVEIIEVGDGTLDIKTKSVKLADFNLYAQTTINVKENGFIVANINLSDESGNLVAQSNIDIAKVMDITLLSNGDLTSTFELQGVEVMFYAYSHGEVKLQMKKDGEIREFNAPIDSNTIMQDDGSFISTNEFSADDGSINSEIVTKPSGEIFAKAINSQGESFELIPPSEASEVNIEVVQTDLLAEFKDSLFERVLKIGSIKDGGLKSTYTVRREFSLKDYFARSVDIAGGSDVIVIPDGEVKCIQNSGFDGKKSVILIEGNASIVIDGKSEEMKLGEEYVLGESKIKNLNLIKGWNLVAIPVQKEVNSSIFEFNSIYIFDNNWTKNPSILSSGIGIWVDSKVETNLTFSGSDYKPNFIDLNGSWKLLGTGQELNNVKANWDFEDVWSYKNKVWEQNPLIINEGQGLWVLP